VEFTAASNLAVETLVHEAVQGANYSVVKIGLYLEFHFFSC